MHVAIIGAGMAGLSCGTALAAAGFTVRLFDKGRGPGGRMATRRIAHGAPGQPEQMLFFDHGAPCFTARDPRFAAQVARWQAAGVIAPWPAADDGGAQAFVGMPGMNAPIKAMAGACDVAFGTRISSIAGAPGRWRLEGEGPGAAEPEREYDALVVAVPAEQAAPLLAPHAADFAQLAAKVVSLPCWTLMAAFDGRLPHRADVIRDGGAIALALRNSAKPGRGGIDGAAPGGPECWVVQAGARWSAEHLELESEAIVPLLLAQLAGLAGPLPPLEHAAAHRWRYAFPDQGAAGPAGCLWDKALALGACGDWLAGPRVENAFLSGLMLAQGMQPDLA